MVTKTNLATGSISRHKIILLTHWDEPTATLTDLFTAYPSFCLIVYIHILSIDIRQLQSDDKHLRI